MSQILTTRELAKELKMSLRMVQDRANPNTPVRRTRLLFDPRDIMGEGSAKRIVYSPPNASGFYRPRYVKNPN